MIVICSGLSDGDQAGPLDEAHHEQADASQNPEEIPEATGFPQCQEGHWSIAYYFHFFSIALYKMIGMDGHRTRTPQNTYLQNQLAPLSCLQNVWPEVYYVTGKSKNGKRTWSGGRHLADSAFFPKAFCRQLFRCWYIRYKPQMEPNVRLVLDDPEED